VLVGLNQMVTSVECIHEPVYIC